MELALSLVRSNSLPQAKVLYKQICQADKNNVEAWISCWVRSMPTWEISLKRFPASSRPSPCNHALSTLICIWPRHICARVNLRTCAQAIESHKMIH